MTAHPALDRRRGYFPRNGALRSPALLFHIAGSALLILTILSIHQARSQGSDSDGDGMPDAWESTHGLSVGSDDSRSDLDLDGVTNLREHTAGTSPTLWDSDGDGDSDYLHVFGPDAFIPETRYSTFRNSSVYPDGSYVEWATSPSHAISKSSYRGDWASAEGFYIGLDPTGVPEYYATWGWGTGGGMNTGTYTYFPDRSSTGSHSETLPDGTSAQWSWGPGYFYQTISQPVGSAYEGTYSYSGAYGTTYFSSYTLNPDLSSSSRSTEFNASGTPIRSSAYAWNPDGSSVSENTEIAYDGSPYYTTYSSSNPDGSSNTRTHYYDQDGDGFSDYDEDYIYGTDKYTPDTFDPASPFDFSPQGTFTRTNPDGTVVQWWWLQGYIYSQTTHPGSTLTEQSYTSFDTAGNITSSGTSRNSPDGSYYSISTTHASDGSPYYDYIYTWNPDGGTFSVIHYHDQDGDGFSDYDEDMIFGTDKHTPDTFDPDSPHDFSPQGTYSRTNPDGTLEQWTWYAGYKEYQLKAADGTPIEGTNSSLDPDGNPTYATSWRYYPDGSYYSITTFYASDGSPYYDYIYIWRPDLTSYSVTDHYDQDGDGLSDYDEDFYLFTSKTQADTDSDGIPDGDELRLGLDPNDSADAAADPDGDGRTNAQEFRDGTDITVADTAPPPADHPGAGDAIGTPDPGISLQFRGKLLFWANGESGSFTRAANYSNTASADDPRAPNSLTFAQRSALFAGVDMGKWVPGSNALEHLSGKGSTPTSPSSYGQNDTDTYIAEASQFRLISTQPPTHEIRRSFIKVSYGNGPPHSPTEQVIGTEVVELTIPAVADPEAPGVGPWVSDGTIDLTPPFLENEYHRISLLPVEIEEVISDQLSGSDCNKLPTAYFGGNPSKPGNGHPNNPMLLATRTGQTAKLKVKISTPNSKIYIGARRIVYLSERRVSTILVGSTSASRNIVDLEFEVPVNSHDKYEIVAGYDANNNSSLDEEEAKIIFERTPRIDKEGNKSTKYLELIDKIIVVDAAQFATSKHETIGYSKLPSTGFAGELLRAFVNGTTTVSGTDGLHTAAELDANIIPSADGLSHPLGARWGSNRRAQTHRLQFTKQSEAAGEIARSAGLSKVIDQVINDNLDDLITDAEGSRGTVQSDPIDFDSKSVNFALTDPYSKAHAAIGKGRFSGVLTVVYRVISPTQIEVETVECEGQCTDLYDFAWGAPPIKFLRLSIDPKNPVMVQAGHASLAEGSNAESGKVFFTSFQFETFDFRRFQVFPKP